MIIDLSSHVNSTASVAATVTNTKKTQNSSADTTKFSTLLNQAIQGPTTATTSTTTSASTSTSTASSTKMAELYSLLMQSQMNSMLSSTLNSTDSTSSSGLASGLLGGGGGSSSSSSSLLSLLSTASMLQGAMPSGTNLTSELLPLLLGSTGNLGGTAGIAMIGNQMPLGTLSTPVVTIPSPSTPSVTDSVNSSTSGVNKSTIQDWVNQYAPRYGLSPKLVNAVITQESGYSPSATSSAGAIGLMQLMPETASMLGVTNPYDPLSNLLGGMSYLGGLMNHYHGNISLALAAYNAGSHAVAQYGGIPPYPETQRYVQDILSLMNHA